jgi:hypothetical protein
MAMISNKKISVVLDTLTEKALYTLMDKNNCSISDVVNFAIISLNEKKEEIPTFGNNLLGKVKVLIKNSEWLTLDNYCEANAIQKARLHYVLRSIDSGKSIAGTGNVTNKTRDKQDDRLFKTHTSWIVHCLNKHFDLQL